MRNFHQKTENFNIVPFCLDVPCLDKTRIAIKVPQNRAGTDYIHANYVNLGSLKKRFICAQVKKIGKESCKSLTDIVNAK